MWRRRGEEVEDDLGMIPDGDDGFGARRHRSSRYERTDMALTCFGDYRAMSYEELATYSEVCIAI
jgi:hypothetical protein